jgi:glycosyltransferase involved in cell wall biosynthesis
MHPPPAREAAPGVKNKTILSVGRFFNSANTHAKRQLDLIQAFKALQQTLHSPDWRLVLVGGCRPEDQDYFESIEAEAKGFPIDVLCNLSGHELNRAFSSASFYWHATGLGESATRHPARFEHFGISVVEAMNAGAVPLVLNIGGPSEIVRSGVDGIHWQTLDQLASETKDLIENPDRAQLLRQNSLERSNNYSRRAYSQQVHKNFP